MPNNIMHLSSRLPKKNYDSSPDGGFLSGDRRPGAGGANFKNQYHNTMGKKKSLIEKEQQPHMLQKQDSQPLINPIDHDQSAVLKLPQIKNGQSPIVPAKPIGRENNRSQLLKNNDSQLNLQKKSPYESRKVVNRSSLND